ncbi:MAG: topoisomerase IV [Ruminococcaceae bacterium]|nr:topoisomerase IV [Oscillospiraceae bacterium]
MAKKKSAKDTLNIAPPAQARDQLITETIEKNYMPYVMTVIISRAIPEIDGFKPSHRKLLYTMYDMGLMKGQMTKSANVVGQTMRLNPHGDAAIYETMVRLTRDHEALLHPFVDSQGSFGKHYSTTDMAYAAPRYTKVKLDGFCNEIFSGIDKDAVDYIPNYDNTMQEPVLLPTSFPNILVTPNMGIAVGMASNICSFNLAEVCDGTIEVLTNPSVDVDRMMEIIKAPDFSTGANLLYDRAALAEIYRTGKGSVKLRSRYVYDKDANCIDIIQIPYSTSIELVMKRITELIKEGKLKEVTDFRDEIDISGFKLTLDLRRGTDPDKLMAKLFKQTPLEDSFACNFNVLIDGSPRQLGIIELMKEWIRFRMGCVKRELSYDLKKKEEKLHLLLGLGKILLDIDRAIKIVRETKAEKDVVPNLMAGFGIDEIQAEYIAEIKLRHLNREYILNRVKEIESLQKEIEELKGLISSEAKIKKLIAKQLKAIKDKYGIARKTQILYDLQDDVIETEEAVENYPCRLVMTKEGYFKKITMQSLRGNDEQKVKEGDEVIYNADDDNLAQLLFFSDKARCYRASADDFGVTKASSMGDFIPAKLGFESDERFLFMLPVHSYEKGRLVMVFANGKAVKVPLSAYEVKGNRKRLTGAYSEASEIVAMLFENDPIELVMVSDDHKAIQLSSALIPEKSTRTAGGVTVFSLKKGAKVREVTTDTEKYAGPKSYKKIKIPATGIPIQTFDPEKQQIKLI